MLRAERNRPRRAGGGAAGQSEGGGEAERGWKG
jgi:hypothetical protein